MSFSNKKKKALALSLSAAVIATNVQPIVSFADEVVVSEQQAVNVTNFNVTKDGDQRVSVQFTIDQELDLGIFTKDNVTIKVENKDGSFSKSKSKTWEGFLNDAEGNKYGMGTKLPAGTYSTVFDYAQFSGKTLDDIRVELVVNNDGIKTTKVFDTSIEEAPVAPEVTQITNVTTNAPDQVLVEFDLSEDINLKLDSKDDIIIRAINKNSGEVLTTKSKTWADYLNDTKGNKIGRGETAVATTYTTVFSNSQIEYMNPSDIAIELDVIKDGEILALDNYNTNENATTEPVKITDVEVNRNMEEALSLNFTIDQTLNLGLDTKDNIEIQVIDKNTGKVLSTKNKTWTGYLNDANGKYGLGSLVKAGTYSTTFSGSQLQYTNPEDVVVKIVTIQNGVASEYVDGQVSEDPEATVTPVNINNLKVTEYGTGALVEFEIDQVLNLKLASKDNLIIKAIDKETGDILTTKNKTWSKYLNAENGDQFGLESVIKPGKYSTVLSEEQIRGIDFANLIVEVTAVKEEVSNSAITEEIELNDTVTIENVAASEFGEGSVKIDFSIDKNINLKLTSKDNITIKAIDRVTKEVLTTKNKTWTDYLNAENGEQFGLNELVVAGTYSNVFTSKQLKDRAMEDVAFEIIVERNGVESRFQLNNIEVPNITDVETHWAKDSIELFMSRGYISGYGDDTFRPDDAMTRAEFIKVVNRVFNLKEATDIDFTDVNENEWYYNEVAIAVNAGYINGYGDDTFKPNKLITREEAAKIIAGLVDLEFDGQIDFKDKADISDWAVDAVDELTDNGIINGYADNTFRPSNVMTRAEAVTALSRTIN